MLDRSKPLCFDDFLAGAEIGTHVETYDRCMAQGWESIFGTDQPEGSQAAGIAVALMMRSYLAATTPRPPGNVHARQRLKLRSLPRHGEHVRTVVSCAGKEIRRERRYVEFAVDAVGENGRALYSGRLTLVWAA